MSGVCPPAPGKPSGLKRRHDEIPQHQFTPSDPPASSYWDSLSKIWLTKSALRELDRRNRLSHRHKHHRSPTQGHRPLTRGLYAELQRRLAPGPPKGCSTATRRDLRQFAKHGGPDLRDLRGYPEPTVPRPIIMSSRSSHRRKGKVCASAPTANTEDTPGTTATTTKTGTSKGSYDPNFYQRMVDARCYPHGYQYQDGSTIPEAHNMDEVQQMLVEPRSSLSPSVFPEEQFKTFQLANTGSKNEAEVMERVLPTIQGTVRDPNGVSRDTSFFNMAKLLDGEPHSAKPDIYYGARPEQIDPTVRKALGQYVVPSSNQTRPCAPNFFVEAKASTGLTSVALNQACYAGAIGARGIHQLQNFGNEMPVYDGNAHTISSTYHDGQLKMYAHHTRQPGGPDTQQEYYMNQLNAWSLTGNRKTFLEGVAAFRNARDWAETQRNAAIEHANATARSNAHILHSPDGDEDKVDYEDDQAQDPIISSVSSQKTLSTHVASSHQATFRESDTSTDELALDYKPSSKRSKGSKGSRRTRRKSASSSAHRHTAEL